ncbi:MAG: XrtA/PEP-CTERM system histidine kinase PrsK, partial [Herbaspirillum sp.]
YGYDYREEWIKFTHTLAIDGPKLGEHVIRAIAELVESPKGILYTRNNVDEYVATADWNLAWRSIPEPASSSLCNFLESKQWVIDIQEYEISSEKYGSLILPTWLRQFPQAGLIVPLVQNTELLGFVVLSRPRSKIKMNWEVTDLLKIVGSQAASYLARQESTDALAVARQFETFNRMSTFVAHDLKNLVSQLALLVDNAEKHKNSPEFQHDMLATIENAVRKMRILLQRFNRESSIEKSGRVLLRELLEKLVISKSMGEPKPQLEPTSSNLLVKADAARLERVVGHLIQNAIEATPKTGRVTVKLSTQHNNAVIEISDTGHGMSEEFVQSRLFKPFESTKAAGMGIGVFETREYVQQLGGQLDVNSRPSIGSTFRISLPLYVNGIDTPSSTENQIPREILNETLDR